MSLSTRNIAIGLCFALSCLIHFLTWDLGPFDGDDVEWTQAAIAVNQGAHWTKFRLPAALGVVASPLVAVINSIAYSISHSLSGLLMSSLFIKWGVLTYLILLGTLTGCVSTMLVAIVLYLTSSGLLAINPVRACPEPYIPLAVSAVLYHFMKFRTQNRVNHLHGAFLWAGVAIHFSHVAIPILPALALATLGLKKITRSQYLLGLSIAYSIISPLLFYLEWQHLMGCFALGAVVYSLVLVLLIDEERRQTLIGRCLALFSLTLLLSLLISEGYFSRLGRLFHASSSEVVGLTAGIATGLGLIAVSVNQWKRTNYFMGLEPFILIPFVATGLFWMKSHWCPMHWLISLTPTAFIMISLALGRVSLPRIGVVAMSAAVFFGIVFDFENGRRPFHFIPLRLKFKMADTYPNHPMHFSYRPTHFVASELDGWKFILGKIVEKGVGKSLEKNEPKLWTPIFLCDQMQFKCQGVSAGAGLSVALTETPGVPWSRVR